MDLLPRQLAQGLLVAGRRRDDYWSLQNVLMIQSGCRFILHARLALSLLLGFTLEFTCEFELN